jgi:hypothetical protein
MPRNAAVRLVAAEAMKQQETMYYACRVRWQQQDGFLLWQNPPEPGRESVWADKWHLVPLFKTQLALSNFTAQLGAKLVKQSPRQLDLDVVAEWLGANKKLPPTECLDAWNLFDDVSAGVNEPFAGNRKTTLRNQVFDLLYATSGRWHQSVAIHWSSEERALLSAILTQGFELWQKHACWQT